MKTVKLITDVNIIDLTDILRSFENEAMAEIIDVQEIMHFNGIRKNFEIHTHITFRPADLIEK